MAPTPDLVSLETLAWRLDCSAAEVERLCRTGALPAPMHLGDLLRWDLDAVLAYVRRANGRTMPAMQPRETSRGRLAANGQTGPEGDPFLAGVERVAPPSRAAAKPEAAAAP